MFSIKFLCGVAIIVCLSSTAYAKRCHICVTDSLKSECDDPFHGGNKFASECDVSKLLNTFIPNVKVETPTATGCLKLKFESKGQVFTTRSCYFGDVSKYKENCHTSAVTMEGTGKQLSCEVCTGDLCNSSTTTGIYAVTVMCLVAIVRMMS